MEGLNPSHLHLCFEDKLELMTCPHPQTTARPHLAGPDFQSLNGLREHCLGLVLGQLTSF